MAERLTAAEWADAEKKRLTVFSKYRMQIAPGRNTETQWRDIFRRHQINANKPAFLKVVKS